VTQRQVLAAAVAAVIGRATRVDLVWLGGRMV